MGVSTAVPVTIQSRCVENFGRSALVSEVQLTVGQTVARARADAGMTVAQVADATRIRATLVHAIEKDDFRLCGGDVYARGHLKSIATAVGLEPAGLLARFDRQEGSARVVSPAVAPIAQPTEVMDAGRSGLGALAGTLGTSVSRGRGTNWSAVMALALVVIVGVAAVVVAHQPLRRRPGRRWPARRPPAPSSTPRRQRRPRAPSPPTPRRRTRRPRDDVGRPGRRRRASSST